MRATPFGAAGAAGGGVVVVVERAIWVWMPAASEQKMEPIWTAEAVVEIWVPGRVSSKEVPRRMVPAASWKAWQMMDWVGRETPLAPLMEISNPGETAGMGVSACGDFF